MTSARAPRLASFAVGAACAAFFVLYAYLPAAAPLRFTSPDESANHFFATRFAEDDALWELERLNLVTDGAVHPRSTRVVGGFIVPGGFIGLPVIYGSIAKATGVAAIPYLTPLFAVLGCLAWAGLVGRVFGRGVGVIAGALLLAQPAWWYGSSRTLMPNVLFLSLLTCGAWFLVAAPLSRAVERKGFAGLPLLRRADGPIAGILIALALAVRPSEAYWLAIAAIAAAAVLRRRVAWRRVALAAAFVALTSVPFLVLQHATYGSAFASGYGSGVAETAVAEVPQGLGNRMLGPLRPLLFPLGFAPRTALAHFWTYGVGFFWGWSLLVAASAVVIVMRRYAAGGAVPAERRAWIWAAAAASAWLVLFYGSWTVRDNPDPLAITIGSSYFRYWLPVFAMSTVPVAWAARAVLEGKHRAGRAALGILAFIAFVIVSGWSVFSAPQEGIIAVRDASVAFDAAARYVAANTPDDAVVIADRADKFLFPERRVVQPLRDDRTFAALPALVRNAPVFYFGITLPPEDVEFLRNGRLRASGLTIDPVGSVGAESLYAITSLASPAP